MNFISLAVSVFIFNNILITITRLLPLKKKRAWQAGIITFFNVGSILGYLVLFIQSNFSLVLLLGILGNILGILIAYIATMMIVLEGITLFKSKRMREFERSIQMKDGKSIPRHILAIVCLGISIVLICYGTISLLHFDQHLLVSIIGSFLGAAIGIGLAIYFFISGNPQHKTLRAQKFLFIVKLQDRDLLYTATLSKEFSIDDAIGGLKDIYILDEYGLLVTPSESYIVKGIKLDGQIQSVLKEIKMAPLLENSFETAIKEFQKYNRKKIILNQENQIVKIKTIK